MDWFFEKFGGVKGYIGGLNSHTVENVSGNKVVFHSKKKVDIKDFHIILGHPNKDILLKTSRNLGVDLNGEDLRVIDVC